MMRAFSASRRWAMPLSPSSIERDGGLSAAAALTPSSSCRAALSASVASPARNVALSSSASTYVVGPWLCARSMTTLERRWLMIWFTLSAARRWPDERRAPFSVVTVSLSSTPADELISTPRKAAMPFMASRLAASRLCPDPTATTYLSFENSAYGFRTQSGRPPPLAHATASETSTEEARRRGAVMRPVILPYREEREETDHEGHGNMPGVAETPRDRAGLREHPRDGDTRR
jgi:hypothetical protein